MLPVYYSECKLLYVYMYIRCNGENFKKKKKESMIASRVLFCLIIISMYECVPFRTCRVRLTPGMTGSLTSPRQER